MPLCQTRLGFELVLDIAFGPLLFGLDPGSRRRSLVERTQAGHETSGHH